MTTGFPGIPASVVDVLRLVWPRHTAQIVGRIIGWSPRTVDDRLQKRLLRDEWEALVDLMASNAEFERQVVALSHRRRQTMGETAPDADRDVLGGPGADRHRGGVGACAEARRAGPRGGAVAGAGGDRGRLGAGRAMALPVAVTRPAGASR